ncbi:MAG: Flp pilus assembly complex ATPase component TadA [Oscillospiraceae bacterium]|nr:Flp pilus assembly complex ATPase component TadA [Oscillospiraceae bacterium]
MALIKKRLGEILIEAGALSQEQLAAALEKQKTNKKRLGDLLIDEGFIKEAEMAEALSRQTGLHLYDLDKNPVDPNALRLINEELARSYMLIPVGITEERQLVVVMTDPFNLMAIDDIRFSSSMDIIPYIGVRSKIAHAIDVGYGKQSSESIVNEVTDEVTIEESTGPEEGEEATIDSATVRLVSNIISQSAVMGASDIHIEPGEKQVRVRYRIDGELQEILQSPMTVHPALVSRIKILGKMDIAEHRVPQDGRVETRIKGRPIDLRISSLPTIYGEKIVIRLLDQSNIQLTKQQLGFSEKQFEVFEDAIRSPNGIFLVTGPTGSGKTTTLYTTLSSVNTPNKNIITVEDPVEYKLAGINQVHINAKAGMTFASALRSILRQDPDIIMLGEIRDAETAEIAVRAAITGHFVLSTIHTNDAASAISRLEDMNVESWMISSALVGVLAQRLVRRICPNCKEEYTPTESDCRFLSIDPNSEEAKNMILHHGKGCANCNFTGYKGRAAIHEILPIYREIREMIINKETSDAITDVARKQFGMATLWDDCMRLVMAGVTTVDEMVKVAFSMG